MPLLLNNLSVRSKISFSFALVCGIVIGLGLFAMQRLGGVNAAAADMRDHWLPSIHALGDIGELTERYRANVGSVLISQTDGERADAEARADKTLQDLRAARATYTPMITPGEEQKLTATFGQAWDEFEAGSNAVLDLLRKGDQAGAAAMFAEAGHERINRVRQALQADKDFNNRSGKEAADGGATVYASACVWIIGALILAVLISAAAGFGIIQGVARPITVMTDAMRRLAQRDMATQIIGLGRRDEIGAMAGAVQVFKDNMVTADQLAVAQQAEQAAKEQRQGHELM